MWEEITKRKLEKNRKNEREGGRGVARGAGRKKNDGGVTVTRWSRLLSRHFARLSRERVIARSIADRYLDDRTGYRAAVIVAIDERKCTQRDVTRRIVCAESSHVAYRVRLNCNNITSNLKKKLQNKMTAIAKNAATRE